MLDRIAVFSNDTAAYIAVPQYRDLAEDYQDLAEAARALGEELSRVEEPDQPALLRLKQALVDIGVRWPPAKVDLLGVLDLNSS